MRNVRLVNVLQAGATGERGKGKGETEESNNKDSENYLKSRERKNCQGTKDSARKSMDGNERIRESRARREFAVHKPLSEEARRNV